MDIVLKWIQKATKEEVKLLVFPESFIPAYPAGLGFGTVVGSRTEAGREQFREYWENSVEVGGKKPCKLQSGLKNTKCTSLLG